LKSKNRPELRCAKTEGAKTAPSLSSMEEKRGEEIPWGTGNEKLKALVEDFSSFNPPQTIRKGWGETPRKRPPKPKRPARGKRKSSQRKS